MDDSQIYKNLKRKRPEKNVPKFDPRNSPAANKKLKLLDSRKKLPIWSRASDIRKALQTHDVLVLSGETGSGKSTQVPQFLVDESWCQGNVAITQPRKVAAISLARRVAEEMGSEVGGRVGKVGYSVRFDDRTGPATRIKYLTEGMLLQEMLRDATLEQYSCIVVDEVHERDVDVDLILGFLKQLLEGKKRKKPLKVVVMSATADVKGISEFFSTRSEAIDSSLDEPSETATKVAICQVEGRQYPVKVHYTGKAVDNDLLGAAWDRIFQIHCKEPMPGDILVFLTGSEAIEGLRKRVEEMAQELTAEYPKLLVLPLYAALSQAAQQRIFEKAPPRTRKVILSTNIAETSVTVPGVRYVIDTGKAKLKQFRSRVGLESLLAKPISKSSAEQRKGRAGREAAGQCFRLFTEEGYRLLDKDNKPEILRSDLSHALLRVTARGVTDVFSFPFLTQPNLESMQRALLELLQLGCLDEGTRKITEIGRKISRLPLTPSLGRVLVEAARPDRDCLLEVIDIVACFQVENIWLPATTDEAREQAEDARSHLTRRQGDHLTYLAVVQAYEAEESDRKLWADKHWISHRAMKDVMRIRKQLQDQCKKQLSPQPTARTAIDEETQINILKCFLRGAKAGAVAQLAPDKTFQTLIGHNKVAIHPSSVLFNRKPLPEAILYQEYVFTNKSYGRSVSAIQMRWYEEMLDDH